MSKPTTGKGSPKGGRPHAKIDWAVVDNCCRIQCTGEETASFVNVDYDTLNSACKREHGVSYSEYFDQKKGAGKISLRRAQYQAAVEDKQPTMLIWLGKQWLGQKDVTHQEVNAKVETSEGSPRERIESQLARIAAAKTAKSDSEQVH